MFFKRVADKNQLLQTSVMSQSNAKKYDLAPRTQQFACTVRTLIKTMPKTFENVDDCKQLLRSSGSVAANYLEANEAVSKKDFLYRIKICRKEAKESQLWIEAMLTLEKTFASHLHTLRQEARELELIFGSIVRKASVKS